MLICSEHCTGAEATERSASSEGRGQGGQLAQGPAGLGHAELLRPAAPPGSAVAPVVGGVRHGGRGRGPVHRAGAEVVQEVAQQLELGERAAGPVAVAVGGQAGGCTGPPPLWVVWLTSQVGQPAATARRTQHGPHTTAQPTRSNSSVYPNKSQSAEKLGPSPGPRRACLGQNASYTAADSSRPVTRRTRARSSRRAATGTTSGSSCGRPERQRKRW